MIFPGHAPNFERQARLAQLSPADAVRALFDGEFGMGDEPAICFAIRRDPRITLDDDAILDAFADLLDEVDDERTSPADHLSPETFLDRLAAPRPRRRR